MHYCKSGFVIGPLGNESGQNIKLKSRARAICVDVAGYTVSKSGFTLIAVCNVIATTHREKLGARTWKPRADGKRIDAACNLSTSRMGLKINDKEKKEREHSHQTKMRYST